MKIIMGENLVYKAQVQVGSHHYARLFAKDNDVLWLSIPWNIFLYAKYGKTGERYLQWNGGNVAESDGMKIWCPFTFVPYRDNFPFNFKENVNRQLKYSLPNMKKVLQREGFDTCDVLWITDPRMMYLSEIVNYKKLVYRCVDDLSHFTGIPSNIIDVERKLVQKADIVFATADTLRERLENYGKTVYSLPNAVDYDFFNKDFSLSKTQIDQLENVIIYVGTIGEWFDCEFIHYCAKKRPNYNFVIIGPERTNAERMKGISNVHLLGKIEYREVPAYIKKAKIGIIPFKKSKLVDAVNPLKLYEYFACGIPVAASEAHELKKISSPAYLYRNYDEALNWFDENMINGCNADELRKYAYNNSWEKRYEYIMDMIRQVYK